MPFGVGSGFLWGWGWLAAIGVIILLGLFLLPWFFFLLNLQSLLNNVAPANRRMSPGLVWLNFIPIFMMGWFIYTIIKVNDSLHAEFRSRSWYIDGDLGYNVGLTTGILWVGAYFIGWIPFIGWVLPLAGVVCWIIYWLKTSDLKNRLDAGPAWKSRRWYSYPYQPEYSPPPGPVAGTPGAEQGPAAQPPAAQPSETGGKTTAETEPQETRCGACGTRYDLEDRFCRGCGLRLP